MVVYLTVDLIDGCVAYRAYHTVALTPEYVWRYDNYDEGANFFRTYAYRTFMYTSGPRMTLGVF